MIHLTALALALASPFSPVPQDPAEAAAELRLTVPVAQLVFEGEAPNWRRTAWMRWDLGPALLPRVLVPGWEGAVELPPIGRGGLSFGKIYDGSIALLGAAPEGELRGELLLPSSVADQLERFPFTVPASAVQESDSRWREIEASHYRALAGTAIPGTPWFRRRAEALVASTAPFEPWATNRSYSVGESFAMFSGGRALAENLALDDVIATDDEEDRLNQDISELEGVTTPMLDFEPLVKGLDVELDALSSKIPHDQHAVFFPSFASLMRVADQLAGDAAPLVQLLDGRSQNMLVRERYERQMCLELSVLARTFGSQFVESVALTGSDTYLRTGSDVALLFHGNVPAIKAMMQAKIKASAEEWGLEPIELDLAGAPVMSAVSAGRELSVYLAAVDGVVIVANSAVQMERLLETAAGTVESLDTAHEYHWFRDRYPLAGEDGAGDAFAVVTDATIRRWASPHWRIATSRRTKAAAILADADAWRLGYGMGLFAADESAAAVDEIYGRLSFLTPISELEIDLVSESERKGYEQWREGYERAWTAKFDPIAIQLNATEDALEIDLTLVPLVVRTDYRDLIELTGTTRLGADVGDFHPEALAHWVAAIDKESSLYRSVSGLADMYGTKGLGLSWVGDYLSVYMDRDDEYFAQLEGADSLDALTEEKLPGLPVGIEVGVSRPLSLVAFLTALRSMVNEAAPGMLEYEAREHGGRQYVAVVPAEGAMFSETPTIFYVVHPDALLFSFSEKLIHRSIDRSIDRSVAGDAGPVAPWVGASTGLHVGPGFKEVLAADIFRLAARDQMRGRSWANLAILNEWKAAGADDPVQYHQDHWGVRLLCAGGGEYVWNDAFQTMESTAFGHPAEPKEGPNLPPGLTTLEGVGGSLTFERIGEEETRGLRAHLKLQR